MAKVTIEDVCRAAWESSRPESAVPYDELIDSYRQMLTARAEGVLAGGWVEPGPFQSFETEVCILADGRGTMQVDSEKPEPAAAEPDEEESEDADEETPKVLQGKLPEDFPYRSILAEAGINTYAQLRKTKHLTDISGIGPARAAEIEAAEQYNG